MEVVDGGNATQRSRLFLSAWLALSTCLRKIMWPTNTFSFGIAKKLRKLRLPLSSVRNHRFLHTQRVLAPSSEHSHRISFSACESEKAQYPLFSRIEIKSRMHDPHRKADRIDLAFRSVREPATFASWGSSSITDGQFFSSLKLAR